jgi:NAD+ kinase
MTSPFKRIMLYNMHDQTIKTLPSWLSERTALIIEKGTAEKHQWTQWPTCDLSVCEAIDLVIVVGGDGNILRVAPWAAKKNIPILGINLGKLGFLADISPQDLSALDAIISGTYQKEKRTLLSVFGHQGKTVEPLGVALNEVALMRGGVMRMVSFDLCINEQFVADYHADGLLISTPTGSTAYALSAGGPILHPALNAFSLVPLCAHRLNSRPIIINDQATIQLKVHADQKCDPIIGLDGHEIIPLNDFDALTIKKSEMPLTLLHPEGHHFFETLKTKLHWEKKHNAYTPDD